MRSLSVSYSIVQVPIRHPKGLQPPIRQGAGYAGVMEMENEGPAVERDMPGDPVE